MGKGFSLFPGIQPIEVERDLDVLLHPEEWPPPEIPSSIEERPPTYAPFAGGRLPFAMFVSDLHMSDFGRGDDFMLGHNNGPVMPVTPKTFLFAQSLVFAMIRARQVGAVGVDLVLNGDTVDVWELLERATLFAHPAFYGLIMAFAAIPGNRVIYIPGNHDAAPLLPPPPVIVAGAYWNPTLSTYATHGHQYDGWNNAPLAPNCPGRSIVHHIAGLEINPGNFVFPGPFPFCLIDNVKPLTYDSVRAYLWRRVRPGLRWAFNLAMAIPQARLAKALINVIGNLAKGEENDKYLENEAMAISLGKAAPGLPAGTKPARIVFGHTHVPCARTPYFNTGTWTPLNSIYWPTGNRNWSSSVETLLDLNPQLYIFVDPATGLVVEEFHYYNTVVPIGPGTPPQFVNPQQIDALRKALYFD